jgi:hypothetical protein
MLPRQSSFHPFKLFTPDGGSRHCRGPSSFGIVLRVPVHAGAHGAGSLTEQLGFSHLADGVRPRVGY